MPSTEKSSEYFALPVTLAWTSGGVKFLPINFAILRHLPGRTHDRIQVIIVSATTAEIATHRFARLLTGWVRIGFEQSDGRHHLTWCTKTTLWTEFINERLLHRMQGAVFFGKAFNGGNGTVPYEMG